MSEDIQEKQCKICLIPIEAQPPTFGMMVSVMLIADKYDEIVICVRDNPILLETTNIITMLSLFFKLPKFMLISHPQDFTEMSEFPQDLPFFNYVATLDEHVYSNLAVKGYMVSLIPKVNGYDDVFCRLAWRQSNALDILRSHIKRTPFNKNKKPTNVNVEEVD